MPFLGTKTGLRSLKRLPSGDSFRSANEYLDWDKSPADWERELSQLLPMKEVKRLSKRILTEARRQEVINDETYYNFEMKYEKRAAEAGAYVALDDRLERYELLMLYHETSKFAGVGPAHFLRLDICENRKHRQKRV